MLTEVRHRLAGIRRRQRIMRSIGWAVGGWFAGTWVALVLAVLWRADWGLAWWTPAAAMAGSTVVAWLLGFAAPLPWRRTAAHVDEHCNLKDRSITAIQFAADDRGDPLRQLQVVDAIDRLSNIDPESVVPWSRPRWLFASVGASIVVAIVMMVPISQPVAAGVPLDRGLLLDQADYLDETMLEELRELAKEDHKEIDELVQELEQLVEELRDPATDQREALAKLSTMQQSISAAMAAFNLQQVDSALQSVASSIEAAKAMQPVAADLHNQDYNEAADKLEQFDPNRLSNKERRTVAGNLQKLSANLGKAKQGQLSEATQQMAEGLEKKNESKCKGGACKLAGLCRKQSLRKSACQCLGSQLSRLCLCKSRCCKNGCNGIGKSDRPSNNWGTGKTNKPLGEKATSIDSNREQVDVTGTQGDGPSEREVISSVEAQQLATRGYQERYREFRKQAEAVLESEPLPLGHRQTVRQYFESIRPTDGDVE